MRPIHVRRALPADKSAIGDLARDSRHAALHIHWTDLHRALRFGTASSTLAGHEGPTRDRTIDLFVATRKEQLGAFWASAIESASLAQLRALAVKDNWSPSGTLGALLDPVTRSLRQDGVSTLAFVGAERWLADALANNGFVRANTIVTMQKGDYGFLTNRDIPLYEFSDEGCKKFKHR